MSSYSEDFSLAEMDESTESQPVRCEFITGEAGTGKSFLIKKRIEDDPHYGILSASTGIAAINLNAVTINSLLKYFDTDSLRDNYVRGYLQASLRKISLRGVRNIVIDEASMVDAGQLDLIYQGVQDTNRLKSVKEPLGIIMVGDFAQLPPVKATWLFKAECWNHFAENTTRLTKVWRQSDPQFLQAINFLRRGDGKSASEIFSQLVKFHPAIDTKAEFTTILGRNDDVDRHNIVRLQLLNGKPLSVQSRRWGKQSGEFKNIPDTLGLKIGAYVMILANEPKTFSFVNGDTGHIEDFDGDYFSIRLVRNDSLVTIGKIHRTVISRDEPLSPPEEEWGEANMGWAPFGKVSFDPERGVWHLGGVEYYPLRLAYASTCHKSQGLSLDAVQLDMRHPFMGSPAMMYVAVSRCRTAQGLRLVGSVQNLIKNTKVDPQVGAYL